MSDPKTNCTRCGRQILQATADRNSGKCAPCVRNALHDDGRYEVAPDDPVRLDVEIDVATLGDFHSVAWNSVEDALFLIASEYVRSFGAFHRDRAFYGLAFDCNADYGQVFICANTPSALTVEAEQCKARSPELYGQFAVEDLEEKLRWSLGDWEFEAFTTEGFSDAWEPIEEFLAEAVPWDDEQRAADFRESFLATACRVMMRLESQGVLDALTQAQGFRTLVADHDESLDESWSRLEAIRRRSG